MMHTPQPTITPSPLEIIDDIIKLWSRITVPFYVNDPNSTHKVYGLGSGFIVERNDDTFLVTALHVLQDLRDGDALAANIGGKGVLLNGIPFITAPEDDIAVAFIEPTWARKQGLTRSFSLSLDDNENERINLNIFVLLGFPGSKNKLNLNTNETTRRLMGYSFSRRIEHPCSSTHIRNPVAFEFDKKTAINTNMNRINVGQFNGNSGGPVLEIQGHQKQTATPSLDVSLAGVFIGWDKHHKELICCRPSVVVNLIDKLVAKLSGSHKEIAKME